VDETAEEMLERFRKEEKIETELHCQKEDKLEGRKSNRESKVLETTTSIRYPERIILLAPGTKVPWSVISRNHGTFKAADLHNAARRLDSEKIGENFVYHDFAISCNLMFQEN